MKNYGDPQSQMCCIGGFLSEVYNNTRLVNLAVGKPKPDNLTQIHDEVMKKLECMAYAHRHDTRISGYPIPFCCESATLQKMYTMEELQAAGIITTMTTSAEPVTSRWPTGSEFEESDITDTEGLCKVTEESTDKEMVWQTHTLMITSDREKVQLEALIKEQDCAIDKAVRQVQEGHLEEVLAIADAVQHREDGRSSFKCRSASERKTSKDPVRSLQSTVPHPKKEDTACTANPNQISSNLASPGRRHLGSQSFTPFGHHSHSRP